jgi:3'(2'), 5'-bisphosphate nucleotidase
MPLSPSPSVLLPKLVELAGRAGDVILAHYHAGTAVRRKADASPVTVADEAAEAVLLEGLRALTPAIPIVAEEEVAAGRVPAIDAGPFWLVDPLDGTREFLSRNGEFTVNLALVDAGQPLLGVVLAPAAGVVWWGAAGEGAARREGERTTAITVRPRPAQGLIAVASRSHRDPETDAWLRAEQVQETVAAGSSLKFCLIAEGRADVYPRFGPTMEWDTAAGHAVLRAAGGRVVTTDGQPLRYGKPGFRNPAFIAHGGPPAARVTAITPTAE